MTKYHIEICIPLGLYEVSNINKGYFFGTKSKNSGIAANLQIATATSFNCAVIGLYL